MSRYHGPQHPGADRETRERRRRAATDRTLAADAQPRPTTTPERDCE